MTPPVQEEHVEQAAIDLFLSLGWLDTIADDLVKHFQIEDLRLAIDEAKKRAEERGVDVAGIAPLGGLARLAALKDAIDKLVHPENTKRQFVLLAGQADRLYRAVDTDARKADLSPDWGALTDIARGLRGYAWNAQPFRKSCTDENTLSSAPFGEDFHFNV